MSDKNQSIEQLIDRIVKHGIVDSIGYPMSIQDTDFKVLYQNKKAKETIGDHVGEHCYQAFEKTEDICEDCPLALSLKDGKVHTIERVSPALEKDLFAEITSSAVKNSSGQIIAGIEIIKDISVRKRMEKERERLIFELTDALARVKVLHGLLPVCASCYKIRNDQGYWSQVDVYIREHSEAEITHGLCPECERKHFPDNFKEENHDKRLES